ncbi:MAG: anti-sigma factor [Myxococcota bacterium]
MREVGGIRCDMVLAVLSDYLDGDLDAATRERVEAHVAGCPECERFGAGFGAMVRSLARKDEGLDEARVQKLAAVLRHEGESKA